MTVRKRGKTFMVDWQEPISPFRRIRQSLGEVPERLAWNMANMVYEDYQLNKVDPFVSGFSFLAYYHGARRAINMLVSEAVEKFLQDRAAVWRPRTKRAYSEVLGAWIRIQKIGDFLISEMTVKHVAPFVLRADISPKSQDNYKRHLKAFFSWCIDQKLLQKNPTDGLKTARVKKDTIAKMIQGDELAQLLNAMDEHLKKVADYNKKQCLWQRDWFTVAVSILVMAGLRRGEVAALKRKHILPNGIHVVAQKGDQERIVPIVPDLREILDKWLERIPNNPEQWILHLTETHKNPITAERIYRVFAKYRTLAGLPKTRTLHGLRHAFITMAFSKYGLSTAEVKLLAGHSSVTVTEGYAHLNVDKIGEKMRLAK